MTFVADRRGSDRDTDGSGSTPVPSPRFGPRGRVDDDDEDDGYVPRHRAGPRHRRARPVRAIGPIVLPDVRLADVRRPEVRERFDRLPLVGRLPAGRARLAVVVAVLGLVVAVAAAVVPGDGEARPLARLSNEAALVQRAAGSEAGGGSGAATAAGSPSGAAGGAGGAAAGAAAGDVPAVERPARPVQAPGVAVPAPSPPVEVEIPSIGVRSSLVDLHLDAEGALEAPEDFALAGWFVDGPQPGQPGPAVIAGHVDSRSGPAVFFRLNELAAGDVVLVHRQDGSTVSFTVTITEQYAKDAFPGQSVYGPVPGPELRLITCGGVFDEAAHSYRDNVVVYATTAAPAPVG